MRTGFLLLFSLCFITQMSFAQKNVFWQSMNPQDIQIKSDAPKNEQPEQYGAFQLDYDALVQYLAKAPVEQFSGKTPTEHTVYLPDQDGNLIAFNVYESNAMRPELSAKYPMIKSYAGWSTDGSKIYTRFDISPNGFHGMFIKDQKAIYIDPFSREDNRYYMAYQLDDLTFKEEHHFDDTEIIKDKEIPTNKRGAAGCDPVDLIIYDLAFATVAEFTQSQGGVTNALSAVNTATNRLNVVFETEVAVRFLLVANNDVLIYDNPNTDPYIMVSDGAGLLVQNQNNLDNVIGTANYDIGHVFTLACTGGLGGVSGGTGNICNDFAKGRGVTCVSGSVLGAVNRIMTHEVGHQAGAGHTWNFCAGSEDQYANSSACSPGGGTTIMSYAGTCGSSNVQGDSDTYLHVCSLEEMYFFTRQGDGSTCSDVEIVDNNTPDLELPYENGFFIPISTPFELTAIASDCDGDDITYCWEQTDLGPAVPLGQASGNSPLFRSFPPNNNPTRIFPRINVIVGNTNVAEEILPDYARDLTFACTIRDGQEGGGGNVWEEVEFRSAGVAGPFRVLQPSLEPIAWKSGEFVEVTWDVANTDAGPVNCERVDIMLSTDGGFTYPDTLAIDALNDGSQMLTMPNITSNAARIKVKAADNIFFDISNQNFQIGEPDTSGFSVALNTAVCEQVCIPEDVNISFSTLSLLGYDSLLTFTANNLPPGAVANFSQNNVAAGADIILTLDMSGVTESGTYMVEIVAEGPGQEPVSREVELITVNSDFSDLALTGPANSTNGLNLLPTFTWDPSANANDYTIQVATSPSFDAGSIVFEETGITDSEAVPTETLNESTLYYWRVIPSNDCGSGIASDIFAFHTENLSCSQFTSNSTPVIVGSNNGSSVDLEILVDQDFPVSDVNVSNITGSYDPMDALRVELISPTPTDLVLFEDRCLTATSFNLGLDDSAPNGIQCPPTGGTFYQPENSLTAFNGESSFGTWTLRVTVISNTGAGGGITNFELEICSNQSSDPPALTTNQTVCVPPGEFNYISSTDLLTEDNNNDPDELRYTIVKAPEFGTLQRQGVDLNVGDDFTQATINAFNLTYVHDGSGNSEDSFQFAVRDGEGGFFGVEEFNIEVDANCIVNTSDIAIANGVNLFPNPTRDILNVQFDQLPSGNLVLDVLDVQGRVLNQYAFNQVDQTVQIPMHTLTAGIYFVRFSTESGVFTKKVSVAR